MSYLALVEFDGNGNDNGNDDNTYDDSTSSSSTNIINGL